MIPSIKNLLQFFTSPKAMLVGIFSGILIGFYVRPVVPFLQPFGEGYKSLLLLCILPIIFIKIIDGLVVILQKKQVGKKLTTLVIVILLNVLFIATLTVGGVLLFKDKIYVSDKQQNTLAISDGQTTTSRWETSDSSDALASQHPVRNVDKNKITVLVKQFIPDNVFTAFQDGMSLKVIILALLMGVALGKTHGETTTYFINTIKVLHEVFYKIFNWVLSLAPLGMMCIFSEVTANFDYSLLRVTLGLTALAYVIGIILIAVYCFIMCCKLKISLFDLIKLFRQPLLLGCATQSNSVAIPSSIEAFSFLKCNKDVTGFVLSLGTKLNRQVDILTFALAATFSMIFYKINFSIENILLVIVLSAFFGSCMSWFALIAMFVFTANMIDMPSTMGITIMTAINALLSFIGIALTLLGNYVAVTFVARDD